MEAKETVVKRVGFYEIDRTIGRGNFAVVKLARHRLTKSQLAIKMIDKKLLDEANLKKVYREVKILKMLDHPNIIKLYQVMETDHFLYLVSEYAPNGELFDYIARNGKMSELDACKLFWQIVCAVDYCHEKGIVHRDLKAENLLLGMDMNVKIADFGFGNFFKPGKELSTWCGSPPYAAPEVFEGLRYCGPEVDVWSLGVVLYVLVCGAFPFDGENLRVLRDRVVAGRFRIPYFMSSECENLIRKMLVVDPKRRTSISHIKRHHWVESMQAREDLILRFHNVAINDLKHPQTSEIYDERILAVMENAGIDRQKTIEALEKEDYNNFYAIYNLLLDRLKQQQQHCLKTFTELSHAFSHAYPRRPSTVADQAVIFPGYRGPVLAETKQGLFSQTTDCVQFHEVPNTVCQRQQMIHTDPCGGLPSLPFRVGRVVPVGRVFPQVSAGRAIATTSIDEGVEADCDEESDGSKEKVGQVPVTSAVGVAEGTDYLSKADTFGCFGSVDMSNQPCVNTATSFDSNIELDAISNVSSSPSGSITYSAVPAEVADVPEYSGDALEEEPVDGQKNSSLSADFREGRRASDGLVVRGVLEFQQQLRKSMKTRGVVELRKELEKLQSETSRDSDTRFLAKPGRFVDAKNTQQRSLEENVSAVQSSSLIVKRTSLPCVDHGALVLQKRLKYGLHTGVCYEPVHSAAFVPNSDAVRGQQGFSPHTSNLRSFKSQPPQVRPYTASPNRQMWQLQTSLKRAHQAQRQDVGGDNGSTAQFRQFQPHFSQRNENPSVVKTTENTLCLRLLSPSFLHGDVPTHRAQLLGEFLPIASSHLAEPTPLVPTCRSQGNLAEYGLRVDSLQAGDSASVGTLMKHPTSCGEVIATAITTDTQEPGAKCHLARRTMFRQLQQQAHVSSCGGEDVGEPNTGDSDSRVDDSSVASTSMDVP